jgi:hypothetical protein
VIAETGKVPVKRLEPAGGGDVVIDEQDGIREVIRERAHSRADREMKDQ